ncbi:nucleotide-diphosphate-sugar epimerase [Streptomyces albospinus]|uniref:Nucleotide-diphosphate-sugar epimerase n=1 Tax=Streptomyces albospinus TaxID=285515 RepID=A0ABQ2VKL7_9ACTN|nr:NAD(P)H-binding protein [Streptomyces albospinus]GGU94278.1 nucleotide-diphosphate-sugar epimerase [Streptomyces albospinus]
MAEQRPILVTGAGGGVGGVGRRVVDRLSASGVPVRALVHREDERARALRVMDGVEVVVGDLTRGADVAAAVGGCRRIFFAMSVSPSYLEATATIAAAALEAGRVEVLVNMSQMTVSQMDLTSPAESRQQHQHWLAEHVLDWSGLPVTHLRPTVFMENPLFAILAAASIRRDGTIRLPFGAARTSPVAARDVADVAVQVLTDPGRHVGHVYELTGAVSRDMAAIAAELSGILGRPVEYVDVPYEQWRAEELAAVGLEPHVREHIATMAKLHSENRYDRSTGDVAALLGRPPSGLDALVESAPRLR